MTTRHAARPAGGGAAPDFGPEASCKGRTESLRSLSEGIQGGEGGEFCFGVSWAQACLCTPLGIHSAPCLGVRGPHRGPMATWKGVELHGAQSPTQHSKENTRTSFSPYDLYMNTCEHQVTKPQKHKVSACRRAWAPTCSKTASNKALRSRERGPTSTERTRPFLSPLALLLTHHPLTLKTLSIQTPQKVTVIRRRSESPLLPETREGCS